ncbi:glycoside hydrolase family 2 protein [Spirosoma utsteinense]|uniref:Beta-galactosidase/beta-glucuronidase n=1 Tax=Spirosoma utsteinense TaxID=2585773 RepID=A0ABR6W432_9BACT|nr:sugar-binding domain-containing protein [Spirosoma utsteinense]MBC3788003.1 beta-galactosidase/beta-glucuronidase [Spirosoma utsteinense]MBC3791298.1 beta-galactosidase/beta-glucuronidase [Spirosoma utsteinense]
MSRWEKQVTAENAWREYPRPQMVRKQWQNLNGMWDYAITARTAPAPTTFSGQILVPFALESTVSKVTKSLMPDQRLWYRRSVSIPGNWAGQRVLLHFGAVDYECSLWINGGLVGSHTGGSDAFSFDITDYLNAGQNQFLLGVTDPTSMGEQPRGKQLMNPNSIWYTPVSGIWQTVWMEPVPKQHYIEEVRLTPEVDSGRIRVDVLLNQPADNATTAIRLTAMEGNRSIASTLVRSGKTAYLPVQNPRLWSPDSPFLYDLKAELVTVTDPFGDTPRNKRPRQDEAIRVTYARAVVTGNPIDEVTGYFAMRKIAVGPGPIANQPVLLLNNTFVFQNGPLDQGWWPGSLLTPPSEAAMTFEIDFLKRSGFNMLRKHIKVEPDRYYYLCDKLGMLVWQDMPSGFLEGQNEEPGDQSEPLRRSKGKEQFELELRRMMNQLHSHPSIVTWVVHNEGWGQYDNERLSAWVKGLDPSRVVNAASGWNDRGAGDFYDIHTYEVEPRAPEPKTNRVVVIGEFGGIGWPIQGHLWNPGMRNWGYQTYQSADAVLKAYQKKYAKIVEYYRKGALSAAVYTQTTDVEGEVNGLLTYDREVIKIPVETLQKIHAPLFKK